MRIFAREVTETQLHSFGDLQPKAFEPILGIMASQHTMEAQARRDVDQESAVGFQRDRRRVKKVDEGPQITPRDPLVDARGIGEPVAYHNRPALKGRAYQPFHMVAARGGEEEEFRFGRPPIRIALDKEGANFLSAG